MKHIMHLMKFSYDKIVNGSKRIEMRLFDTEHQKIKLNDVIEFICQENNERLLCLVRGLVVFERFDDLIALFPAKIFGYDNKEEVRVRINRRFGYEEQLINHVVGIIIMPLQVHTPQTNQEQKDHIIKENTLEQKPFKKTYSEVKQMLKEEAYWKPVNQNISHHEEEESEKQEKIAKLREIRLRKLENEGRE